MALWTLLLPTSDMAVHELSTANNASVILERLFANSMKELFSPLIQKVVWTSRNSLLFWYPYLFTSPFDE